MRIAYLGNFSAPHCTEVHLAKTMEAMGHSIVPLQENKVDVEEAVRAGNSCELFLWTRTRGFLQGDGFDMLNRIHTKTASYHLDLYNKISRMHEVPLDPFWASDVCFSPDGGSNDFFRGYNINHYYLKAGVFEPECYLAEQKPDMDVVFVGSYGYHPEWDYRPKLVDWLRATYGPMFHKFGNPEGCTRGHDLNLVYARSKVVVGDTLCPGFNHPHYWSDRVYETLGRGGFLIHPWIAGMQGEFVDGVHLRYYEYGNFKMLKSLIDYYVRRDSERERIRLAGHERVKQCATYRHRLLEALRVIESTERRRKSCDNSRPRKLVEPLNLAGALAADDGWRPPFMEKIAI